MVPVKEIEGFLVGINITCHLKWELVKLERVDGLIIRFPDDCQPKPNFLGVSKCRQDYDRLQGMVPAPNESEESSLNKGLSAGDTGTEAFLEKLNMASTLLKNHRNSGKAKKEKRRIEAKEGEE